MPSLWNRHPGVRHDDDLTRGERAADVMRNGMGSWSVCRDGEDPRPASGL